MPFPGGQISSRFLCSGAVNTRTIASDAVTGDKIADGAIADIGLFDSGLRPVQIVSTLPGTADQGDLAFLTTDNKLYRYDGGSWIVAVDGADIVDGTIVASDKIQANSITADEIAANTITGGQIAAGAIATDELDANAVTAAKLAAVNIEVGKYIRSTIYSPGSSGWSIEADGSAEFDNVTVRGSIGTSSVVGDLTLSGGTISTDSSGNRRATLDGDSVDFYDASNVLKARLRVDSGTNNFTMARTGGGSIELTSDGAEFGSDIVMQTGAQINLEHGDTSITSLPKIGAFYFGASGTYAFMTSGNSSSITDPYSWGFIGNAFRVRTGTDISAGSDRLIVGDTVQVPDGSSSAPGLAFFQDTNTGIYRIAENTIGFSIAGEVARFDAGGLVMAGGRQIEIDIAGDALVWGNNGGSEPDGPGRLKLESGGQIRMGLYNAGWQEWILIGSNAVQLGSAGSTNLNVHSNGDLSVRGAIRAGNVSTTALTDGYLYADPTTGSSINAHWVLATGSTYYLTRQTSSRRWKKDIEDHEGSHLDDLRVVSFVGQTDGEWHDYRTVGLIAEEAHEVWPEIVALDEDDIPMAIDTAPIVAELIQETQVLRRRVAALEASL